MTAPDLKPTFYFDRYINGVKMAEDVCVERASSLSAAMVVASKIASRGPNGEAPVLVYRPTPLAEALAVPTEAQIAAAVNAVWSEMEDSKTQRWTLRKEHIHNAIATALAPTDAPHVNETPKSEHDGADVLTDAAQAREAALMEAHKAILAMDTKKDEDLTYNLAVLRAAEKVRRLIGEARDD